MFHIHMQILKQNRTPAHTFHSMRAVNRTHSPPSPSSPPPSPPPPSPPRARMPKASRHDGAIDCFAGREINNVISPEPTGTEGHVSPRKRQPGLTGTMTRIQKATPQPCIVASE